MTAPRVPVYPEDMHASAQYWMTLARRDLDSASVLLSADDTANCLMLCQQAVEKALKALIQASSPEPPPRIHNLVRLAEIAGLIGVLPDALLETLADLNPFITEGRYPVPQADGSVPAPSSELAGDLLERAEEVLTWLSARPK